MAAASSGIDYGLDDPLLVRRWFGRAGWTLGLGIFVWLINKSEYPGPSGEILAVAIFLALLCAGVAWFKIRSSREQKAKLVEQLLDSLQLKGDEKALDVGCGRGLLTIAAVQRLKAGKVTGIDTWDPHTVSGNSIEAAKENAKAGGVADRIRYETLHQEPVAGSNSIKKLVYPENHFDVVTSCWWLHRLPGDTEREQILREIYRVLKPGGRILIYDTLETGHYADFLRKLGTKDVALSPWNFLWCVPGRTVSAQK